MLYGEAQVVWVPNDLGLKKDLGRHSLCHSRKFAHLLGPLLEHEW